MRRDFIGTLGLLLSVSIHGPTNASAIGNYLRLLPPNTLTETHGFSTAKTVHLQDSIKLAYVIGEDSRKKGAAYPVSSRYYNSVLQSSMAKNNLVHLQCKKGARWNKNTTSGFFIDVEAYAKDNNIAGDFSSCRNKLLLSVAHYIDDRGGENGAECKIRKSFETQLGPSEYGLVTNIHTGKPSPKETLSSSKNSDFAIIKIDAIRFSQNPNFKTLKICPDYKAKSSFSGNKCRRDFEDEIIMPQLALSRRDISARKKGLNYKAKISSGKCCISKKDPRYNLLRHTCDMEARSSGSPLLRISGTGEPCVIGIQKGNSYEKIPGVKLENNHTKKNYAVSVMDTAFKTQLRDYIQTQCSPDDHSK